MDSLTHSFILLVLVSTLVTGQDRQTTYKYGNMDNSMLNVVSKENVEDPISDPESQPTTKAVQEIPYPESTAIPSQPAAQLLQSLMEQIASTLGNDPQLLKSLMSIMTSSKSYSQLLQMFLKLSGGQAPNISKLNMFLQNPELKSLFEQFSNSTDTSSMQTVLSGLENVLQIAENSTDTPLQKMLMMLGSSGGSGGTSLNTLVSFLQTGLSGLQMFLRPESLTSEDQCAADVSSYLQGIMKTELWALKMLDSSGKPGTSILEGALNFLGNYDECLSISTEIANENTATSHVIEGNYCHLFFILPNSIADLTSAKLPIKISGPTLQWNLCLPKSCNDTHLNKAVSKLPLSELHINLSSAYFVKHKEWKDDSVSIAAIAVFSVVVLLSALGTLYDVISADIRKRDCEKGEKQTNGDLSHHGKSNGINGTAEDELGNVIIYRGRSVEEKRKSDGFGRQLLLSFSLSRNTEKILNTKAGDSNLGCIHGIRVLSMAWVILGHSISWDSMNSVSNKAQYGGWMHRFTFQFLLNGTLSVDTFFIMSGCLLTYLFLKECEKSKKGKPTFGQMVLYYVHRYWRLTPVYMLVILFYTGLLDYMIDGPLVEGKLLFHGDHCRKLWWTNLLYINNFYKITEMCFPVSWFLAIDMQLYVIAPIVLLPLGFGIYWLGYFSLFLLLATHLSTYGYFEWSTGGSSGFVNSKANMQEIYLKPWCRVGTFTIGMIVGVILYRTKCKTRLSRVGLFVGWQVFLAIGLLCTYITYDNFREGSMGWGFNARIIDETLSRIGWALFVGWIIFVCCTGHGGFVNSILSWSAWVPLGRLTYGAYLTHPCVLSYTDFNFRALVYNDVPRLGYHFIGTFVVSYAFSFLLSVFMESPCMGLERTVLKKLGVKK